MRLSLGSLLRSLFTVFVVISHRVICASRSWDGDDCPSQRDACLEHFPPDTIAVADPISDATRATALLQRQIGKPSRQAAPHESRPANKVAGSKVPLTEQGFKLVMDTSNNDEKVVFVRRVASRLGLGAPTKAKLREWMPVIDKKVSNQPSFDLNALSAFIRKALREPANMESKASTNGQDMETDIEKKQAGREEDESKEAKNKQAASLMHIVLRAPLDEEGYMSVAALRNQKTMERYVRRAISERKLKVKDEGALMGVLPFYSGTKATQSFAALTREITRGATRKHPWLVPRDV